MTASGRCSRQPTELVNYFFCRIYSKGNHLKQQAFYYSKYFKLKTTGLIVL